MGLYNKLKESMDEPDEFSSEVTPEVVIQGDYDVAEVQTVRIPYRLIVDYSSIGIKSIDLLVTETITVDYVLLDMSTDEEIEKSVKVDLSTSEIEWQPGGQYSVDGLLLNLTEDGGLVRSTILATYIEQR